MSDLDQPVAMRIRDVDELRKAVRCVASGAADPADCALLLNVLGLNPAAGKLGEGEAG